MKLHTLLLPTFVAALVTGCATTQPRYDNNGLNRDGFARVDSRTVGTIASIESAKRGNDSALAGTVIGGVVGAVAGHQVGEGRTNDAATVAGAVGGAAVGRKIDKAHDRKAIDLYTVRVRLNDGDYETVTQESVNGLRVGDRVRIDENGVHSF